MFPICQPLISLHWHHLHQKNWTVTLRCLFKPFPHVLVNFESPVIKMFSPVLRLRSFPLIFCWFLLLVFRPGVVTCICNPTTLEDEFRNGVDSLPVRGNSLSIGGWIVWAPVIQHKERSLSRYWDITRDLKTNPDSKLG